MGSSVSCINLPDNAHMQVATSNTTPIYLPPCLHVRQTEAGRVLTAHRTFLDFAPSGLLMPPYKCWDNEHFRTCVDCGDHCWRRWLIALVEVWEPLLEAHRPLTAS